MLMVERLIIKFDRQITEWDNGPMQKDEKIRFHIFVDIFVIAVFKRIETEE